MPGLSSLVDLDDSHLWEALSRVRLAAHRRADGSEVDAVIDAIVGELDADRGMLALEHPDGGISLIYARGVAGGLDLAEREEASRSVIHRAMRSRTTIFHDPLGSASESMTELEITCAIAVPVAAASPGVLYVDFRTDGKYAGERHVEFLEACAEVLALVLDRDTRAQTLPARASASSAEVGVSLEHLLTLPGFAPLAAEVRAALVGGQPILLTGETGVGKTLLARAMARAMGGRPVVRATLGSSDDLNTITSELFGHERGAFSGAVSRRVGLVAMADSGVLILDEVLSLPHHAQQLLLDFVQFGTYRPLGHAGSAPLRADVALIAVTNGELSAAIDEGRFRRDLYFRIAGQEIAVPPLRERRADIPALVERQLAAEAGSWTLSLDARRALLSDEHRWAGNVRELEQRVRTARARAMVEDADASRIEARHFNASLSRAAHTTGPARKETPSSESGLRERWSALGEAREQLDRREASLIAEAVSASGGVIARAARALGAKRTGLLSRMKTLRGVRPPR